VREVLKDSACFHQIKALVLADGLHSSSTPSVKAVQMADFAAFASQARDGQKVLTVTHSSIATYGYQSTTQTADYLANATGAAFQPLTATDSIGTQYRQCDTGQLHIRGYHGATASDHVHHLHHLDLSLRQADSLLRPAMPDTCLPPGGLRVVHRSPVAVTLLWDARPGTDHYQLRGQRVGASNWVYLQIPGNAGGQKAIEHLKAGEKYVWQMRAKCQAGLPLSAWSATDTFETGCQPPDSIWASKVTVDGALLHFTPVPRAVGYEIKGRKAGSTVWQSRLITGASDSTFYLDGLEAQTAYVWKIRTACDSAGQYPSSYGAAQAFITAPYHGFQNWEHNETLPEIRPAGRKVFITTKPAASGSGKTIAIRLWDRTGRLCFVGEIAPGGVAAVDLAGLSPGIYVAQAGGARRQAVVLF